MAAIRIYRRLQDQRDVDPNGLPHLGVPRYHTDASSFVVETIGGGGGGGSFSLGVSNLGNTLGDTGVTGTRVVLAGEGIITLSQATDANGGTITISGGTAPSFSAGISGGNTAGDTGVTGTRLALAGGNNITLSGATDGNGGTVTVVGPNTVAQTVQTQNLFDLTVDGNTAGVPALVSSGTLTLAGGNSITLSQNGNAITISGATTSQSVQTQNVVDVTLSGNTAGALALVSSGTMTLAGGNRITVSQAGNAVTISGPNAQTGISSIVASDATYTSGSVQFTGSNMITVRSSANQRVVIDATQSVQTQNVVDVTMSGNTAGAGALVSSGTLTLAGGNNITLSQAGNAITISGANVAGAQTGISGIANSQTTYTSGTVSLSELGAITIRSTTGNQFQFSVAAQTAESQSIGMSNVGNTSGTTGVASGAQVRFVFAGGNSITLSQSLNGASGTITISGPSISESIGMSNLGNTSGTTGVASGPQVRYLLAGGNNITLSQSLNGASGTLTISAASQTVQTQNVHNVTLSGNTAGVMAQISSGTMTLAGGNNITVSQNGNAVTISGPNVGGAQTGISGIIASDATYTSGTVEFTGSNMVTVKSSAGQRVVIDATQSVQSVGLFALGNTTGESSSTTRDARSLSIRGDGAVSVGYSAGSLRISAPVQTGTQFSGGLSNLGNTAGDTGTVAGRLVLVGSNNITLSGSTNGASMTVSIAGGAGGSDSDVTQITQTGHGFSVGDWVRLDGTDYVLAQADTVENAEVVGVVSAVADANSFTLTTGGLVTGLTGLTAGAVYFLDDTTPGAITDTAPTTEGSVEKPVFIARSTTSGYVFNMRGNVIPASAMTAFLAGVSNVGNTLGDTGITGSRLVLAGGNNITLSQSTNASGGTVTISAPNTAAQTDQTLGLYAVQNTTGQSSSTTRDARSISVAGDGAVSVGYSAGSLRISAPTQSVQPGIQHLVASNATFSSGTVSISGFGDVTVNTAANLIRISAPVQTAESQSIGMSNIGNTSGTTGIASGAQVRFLLAGGNNITLSQSLNGASGTITISAPNAVAQTNQTLGMYAVQNTTGQSSSTTMDARTLSIAGDGAVSVGYSAGSLRISAPTQTGTQFSAGISGGNTAGDTGTVAGRLVLAGGANITLSGSTNGASETVSIVGGGGGGFSAGVSDQGNTAGATGVTGTRLVLVGTNNITLSQTTGAAGATISISGQSPAGGAFSGGASTGGNTAGATGITGTQLVLVGTGPISLSQTTGANGGTLSIDAPATSSLVGASGVMVSTNGSTISVFHSNRTQFYPFNDIPIVTGQQGQATLHIAPLHFPNIQHDRVLLGMQISNATNSSNSITISAWVGLYSRSASSISLISSTSGSTNFSGSGTVGSYSLYGGPKWLSIPWTNTVTEDDYWFGIVIRTTTGGGAGHTVSQLCVSKFTNSAWSGIIGQGTGATDQYQLGLGVYTASTSGIPASIAFSQINGSGSMALREPIFHLRSGTV